MAEQKLKEELALDTLIVTILYLMSRYSKCRDQNLIGEINKHLQKLSEHSDCKSNLIKDNCRRLQMYWFSMNFEETGKEQDSIPDPLCTALNPLSVH